MGCAYASPQATCDDTGTPAEIVACHKAADRQALLATQFALAQESVQEVNKWCIGYDHNDLNLCYVKYLTVNYEKLRLASKPPLLPEIEQYFKTTIEKIKSRLTEY